MGGTAAGDAIADVDGIATLDFVIPDNIGSGQKNATTVFDGDSNHTGFNRTVMSPTVLKTRSWIDIFNAQGAYGQPITLKARLWRIHDGANIVGRSVTLTVEGDPAFSATAVTDANGIATVDYTIPASLGTSGKNVTASFAGDAAYPLFTRTAGVLTVNP